MKRGINDLPSILMTKPTVASTNLFPLIGYIDIALLEQEIHNTLGIAFSEMHIWSPRASHPVTNQGAPDADFWGYTDGMCYIGTAQDPYVLEVDGIHDAAKITTAIAVHVARPAVTSKAKNLAATYPTLKKVSLRAVIDPITPKG